MIYGVLIWIGLGIVGAMIASSKGNSGCFGFIIGVLLGPIGLLINFFSSNDEAELRKRRGDTQRCPYCSEYVKKEAVVCKHCGRRLTDSEFNINQFRK